MSQTQPIILNNLMHPVTLVHRQRAAKGPDGSPDFVVKQLTLKPGANALSVEDYELVAQLREKNPLVKARFERTVQRFGAVVVLNVGKPELEDATKMDRGALQQAIRACSDPASLRKLREAFGGDKVLAELIENQLAATTVTTEGEPIPGATDVRRDPRDPRKAA